jgi:hypothetical protein
MGIDAHTERRLIEIFSQNPLVSLSNSPEKRALLLGRPTMMNTSHQTPETLFNAVGADIFDSVDVTTGEGPT